MPNTNTFSPAQSPHGHDVHAGPFPVVVVTILVLNLLIFVFQTLTGGSTNTFNLVRFGAQHGPSIENGEYWRFVTAAFLHIGIWHLIFNSIGLFVLGRLLERLYGSTHFAFLYLISGVGGTFTSFFLNEFASPQTVSAGASGAIFGVAAAMLVAGLRYADQIPESLQQAFGTGMLPFLGFNLYYGFTHGAIDNYAHIGGALTGAIGGWVLHPHQEDRRASRLATGVFVALVLASFGLQYRGVIRNEREIRRAFDLFQAHRFAEAQSIVEVIRRKGIEDARVLTLGGMLKVRQGKIGAALADFREAEKIAPRYAPAKTARAQAMMLIKAYPAAAVTYRQVLAIDPADATAHSGFCGAMAALGRLDEAVAACREALRLDPKLASAQIGLALTLERQEKFEESAAAYREAVMLEPKSPAARHGLVRVLLNLGLNDEAAVQLRELLAFEPGDEAARKLLREMEIPKSGR